MEVVEVRKSFVERSVGGGGGEFDGGDEDGVGAEGAQSVGQLGGLMGGTGDEDAWFLHGQNGLLRLAGNAEVKSQHQRSPNFP